MTETSLAKVSQSVRFERALKDYAVLRERVKEVLIVGRRRVEREFMFMRYQTGLLINEHIRLNDARAGYGQQAVLKLEKDFDVDHTELLRYAQFAKAYPIVGDRRQLRFCMPWMHYRKLMTVKDDDLRWKLTLEAEQKEWTFEQVDIRVRRALPDRAEDGARARLSEVALGPFFTYKMIRSKDIHTDAAPLMLDLGFQYRLEAGLFRNAARLREGTIVTGGEGGAFKLTPLKDADDASLYTYKARVESVVDGDTLKVDFILGFGSHKGEKIRLNHIDCPELSTPEGKAAKRFVEKELAGVKFITVKSVRTQKEKWGRYLGEVFYQREGKDPLIYLNQLLLDEGHAARVSD